MSHAVAIVTSLLAGVAVLLMATVAFDLVHVALHRLQGVRAPWLRVIGDWHAVHHRFLGRDLVVDPGLVAANLRWHVLPEYVTHVAFTASLLLVVPLGPVAVALVLETIVFAAILRARGLDVNHRPRTRVPAYRPGVVCLPAYHALHHVRPTAFYSSWIPVVDMLLGTTVALPGRTAAIVGASGEMATAMAHALEAATGRPVAMPELRSGATTAVAEPTDLVVLIPPKTVSADAITEWIEGAIAATSGRLVPIEVWVVVSTGAAFVAEGRGYMDDRRLIYRHVIVAPAGATASSRTVRTVLAHIRRGSHRIHTGSRRTRFRDWLTWRRVRPMRRGARAGALA